MTKYFATLEGPDGKIETYNGVLEYKVDGPFLYLAGVDFEVFISPNFYRMIEISEGGL